MPERTKTQPLIHPNLSEMSNPAREFADGIIAQINSYDQDEKEKHWPYAKIILKIRHPVDKEAYQIIRSELGLNQRGKTYKGLVGISSRGHILEITRTSRNKERPTIVVKETRELFVDETDTLAQDDYPASNTQFENANLTEVIIEVRDKNTTIINADFEDLHPEKVGLVRRVRDKIGL